MVSKTKTTRTIVTKIISFHLYCILVLIDIIVLDINSDSDNNRSYGIIEFHIMISFFSITVLAITDNTKTVNCLETTTLLLKYYN